MFSIPEIEAIATEQISPTILHASIFNRERNIQTTTPLKRRFVYDYELEYILFSAGAMWLNNALYPLHPGDIILRRPGQITQGIKPYSCYLICFDLTGTSGKTIPTYNFKFETQFQHFFHNPFLDALPLIFHPKSNKIYETLFNSLFTEFHTFSENSSIITKAHLLRLLYQFHTDVTQNQPTIPLSSHYTRLKRSIDYMRESFTSRITLHDIARVAELSPTYFHKIFTATFTITPNEYLNQIRLDKAKELLAKTSDSIQNISSSCGFENPAYFSYLFKQHQQCSPTKYREKYSYI